jgi:hypothetical protein
MTKRENEIYSHNPLQIGSESICKVNERTLLPGCIFRPLINLSWSKHMRQSALFAPLPARILFFIQPLLAPAWVVGHIFQHGSLIPRFSRNSGSILFFSLIRAYKQADESDEHGDNEKHRQYDDDPLVLYRCGECAIRGAWALGWDWRWKWKEDMCHDEFFLRFVRFRYVVRLFCGVRHIWRFIFRVLHWEKRKENRKA